MLAAVVGSYSSIQGLLIWPIGLVLLYHRRRPTWAFLTWIVTALAAPALYFHNYHFTAPALLILRSITHSVRQVLPVLLG